MILDKCFKKEWIEDRSKHFKRGKISADVQLIEKVIYALGLLESLSKANVDFIFKGGTCLLLLLKQVNRFSIDIDIIIEAMGKEELEKKLDSIIKESKIFYRYEEHIRYPSKDIPKAHYKFFYKSDLDESEKYILLDILFEKCSYSKIIEKEIKCDFIELDDEIIKVKTPDINCILGDKLTAFAPETTGIMYGKEKQLEIIKQLYDISNLFDESDDLSIIRETFKKIATQELSYRKGEGLSYNNVLDDIFNTSINIITKGKLSLDNFKELEDGVKRIKGYIFSSNFIMESAVECACKAAYLAMLIKSKHSEIEKYDESIDIKTINITDTKLSKISKGIKKYSPKGYYYLYKAINIYTNLLSEVAADKI